jgi:FtsP/CotA-like multicopper oxidase with cupredoxin domain
MIADGSTEVWHFLNLTKNMHPMHLHLVQFQAIRRDLYDVIGFDGETTKGRIMSISSCSSMWQ